MLVRIIPFFSAFLYLSGCVTHSEVLVQPKTEIVNSEDVAAKPLTPSSRVFFSPKAGCETHIVDLINNAKSSLEVAVYSINNQNIIEALKNAKKRGVNVRILTDRTQASINCQATLDLSQSKIDIRIHSKNRMQHNKYAVADDAIVVTGSFNWTYPAEMFNEENCLFITDREIVKPYLERFENHLWLENSFEKSELAFQKLKSKKECLQGKKTLIK